MPNYRLVAPTIRWGANLANAIYFPFPADSVFSGSDPRAGSEFAQAPSGVEAASRVGTDYVWAGTQRWIAQSDTLFYPRCTGWDGTLGIRAALESLQNRQTFSWHSDGRNLVRHPLLSLAGDGVGGTAGSTTAIYNQWVGAKNGTPTGPNTLFDGAEPAWKVLATGSTGASDVDLRQFFPVIPGESLCLSADYKVSALAGGANAVIGILIYDSTGTSLLQTHATASGLVSTTYARATTGLGGTVTPAGAAFAQAVLRLTFPNGASGNAWFKNVTLQRSTADTSFIDNPSVDGCYLVDPTQFSPANESDGSRQLVMKIRNPSAPFDGY